MCADYHSIAVYHMYVDYHSLRSVSHVLTTTGLGVNPMCVDYHTGREISHVC